MRLTRRWSMVGGEHRQICSVLGKRRYVDSLVSESSVRQMRDEPDGRMWIGHGWTLIWIEVR